MTDPTIAQTVLFPDVFDKPVGAAFDRERASSEGGAILLKAADRVYGLVKTCVGPRPHTFKGGVYRTQFSWTHDYATRL